MATFEWAGGQGGTDASPALSSDCYAAGTHIATPAGEAPVEALRPGDAVLVLAGTRRVMRRVRWVGRMTVDLDRHPAPARAAPIRIRAHAIAEGVPHRDLLVSPDHAVFLHGALVQAQAMANGATILREPPRGRVTYHHIELHRHALLLAEGLPAESYLDTGNRSWFAAEAGVRPLFPDLATARHGRAQACARLVLGGPALAAAHAAVAARAQTLGHARTEDPGLSVLADGVAVPLAEVAPLHWRARLPAGTRHIRLLSRTFVPHEADPTNPDRRRLGLAVQDARLAGRAVPRAAFGPGWHTPEAAWRWSDGDAHLAPRPRAKATVLEIRAAAAAAFYWLAPAPEGDAGLGCRTD